MFVHAYTAYAIAPGDDGLQDFNYFTDGVDSYAEKAAASGYDEAVALGGLAVTEYRIEVPTDVKNAHFAGDRDALTNFIDGLEWHDRWEGVEIVRRNHVAGALEAASVARATERAATTA